MRLRGELSEHTSERSSKMVVYGPEFTKETKSGETVAVTYRLIYHY